MDSIRALRATLLLAIACTWLCGGVWASHAGGGGECAASASSPFDTPPMRAEGGVCEAVLSCEDFLRACREGNVTRVRYVLDTAQCNVNVADEESERTCIHFAAGYRHKPVVDVLLASYAPDVTLADASGRTVLWYAAGSGHEDVVAELLVRGATGAMAPPRRVYSHAGKRFSRAYSPCMTAVSFARSRAASVLLDHQQCNLTEVGPKGRRLVHLAAEKGLWEVVEQLAYYGGLEMLTRSVNDTEENTPIHLAAYQGHTDVVRVLLDAGVDANARTRELSFAPSLTPLLIAAARGHTELVELLLRHGANATADHGGWQSLHYAAAYGHYPIAWRLLEHLRGTPGAVDARTLLGSTPLMFASMVDNAETLRVLLDAGADVNAHTQAGWTPLHMAVFESLPDVATQLLARGADPTFVDEQGNTPGELARARGVAELFPALAAQ